LAAWVSERAAPEKITGVAVYISFGDPGPAVEAFAGKVGVDPKDPLVRQNTLFQMGSTSKSFTGCRNPEAGGGRQTVPRRHDWEMAAAIFSLEGRKHPAPPQYDERHPELFETETLAREWVNKPTRDLTAAELVRIVYPTGRNDLPPSHGYYYSNTNYILAGMIAAKAAGRSYRDLVHQMIIDAFGLDSTFYESGSYSLAVMQRLAHGYFDNPACADYQPGCQESWSRPLMGRDVRGMSTSWTQAAGGAIANARDVDRWMRAVFEGHVVPPRQQAEWKALVSTKTGEPIADVSPDDPRGFSLGLSKGILGTVGAQWFYQGETLGYRTLYVWFDKQNLMITLQTNSQPAADADKLNVLAGTLYQIVGNEAKQ
jgi:D-alanyl-D-alanine carboxypeptidase